MANKLSDIHVDKISLVGLAANRRRWTLFKSVHPEDLGSYVSSTLHLKGFDEGDVARAVGISLRRLRDIMRGAGAEVDDDLLRRFGQALKVDLKTLKLQRGDDREPGHLEKLAEAFAELDPEVRVAIRKKLIGDASSPHQEEKMGTSHIDVLKAAFAPSGDGVKVVALKKAAGEETPSLKTLGEAKFAELMAEARRADPGADFSALHTRVVKSIEGAIALELELSPLGDLPADRAFARLEAEYGDYTQQLATKLLLGR